WVPSASAPAMSTVRPQYRNGSGNGQAWSWHQNKRSWEKGLSQIVMALCVPATHAPAVVQPPWWPHRPGAGGRDTQGHDGERKRIRLSPAPADVRDALPRRMRASAPPEGPEVEPAGVTAVS